MLNTLSSKELKDLGKQHKIRNWWNLRKDELIAELSKLNLTIEQSETSPELPTASQAPTSDVTRLSDVVKGLENLFDLLNKLYFENALTRPVITVQSTPRAMGHCSTKQIWKSENEAMYEINIGAEFLNKPKEVTADTMCHEMIHLYCRENDIAETSQNGRYHNAKFKDEAEARDLIVDYTSAKGHAFTTPSEEFTKKLVTNGYDLSIPFARHTVEARKTARRTKAHAYICPSCGQTVRTTQELTLKCGTCDVAMEMEV